MESINQCWVIMVQHVWDVLSPLIQILFVASIKYASLFNQPNTIRPSYITLLYIGNYIISYAILMFFCNNVLSSSICSCNKLSTQYTRSYFLICMFCINVSKCKCKSATVLNSTFLYRIRWINSKYSSDVILLNYNNVYLLKLHELQPGGEMYFSDVYCDKKIPDELRKHKVLWGNNKIIFHLLKLQESIQSFFNSNLHYVHMGPQIGSNRFGSHVHLDCAH